MRIITALILLLGMGCTINKPDLNNDVHLTLIPPGMITNKIDLDIRAGIKNNSDKNQNWTVELFVYSSSKETLIHQEKISLSATEAIEIKHIIPKGSLLGKHIVKLKLTHQNGATLEAEKKVEVVESAFRSTQTIDGAWAGIYHWSEIEGKHWNPDIQKLTDDQWKKMIKGMHQLNMNMIVIQEVFRKDAYAGKNSLTVENYDGKAFYPSSIYPGRMDISAEDPIEAILSEADRLDMNVWMGVGLFAWFDFSPESLKWHISIAEELWQKYGHHPSFYGFYVSEEMGGSLDNWETTEEMQQFRKKEMVHFFKEFKSYTTSIAPGKPVMLATNSMEVPKGADTYPELLKYLDILCPFGFARMPENDLTGEQAANMLQKFCDDAGAHLWFDQEVFLFNPDTSLYPRDFEGILHDLNLFKNFEKILCYQYPGVFNDPIETFVVGDTTSLSLFTKYKEYQNTQRNKLRKKN
ncbi:DUF4434 domain-containing protein [Gynurincola endophyticus]|uniref:DUF4434 domain-containing protein n=1 Tax=Gynurincola endophyticus TaxID=2479004 RepID=UPI0018F3A9C3|nr:DUF4434 domain-containing protein [Gynurincola endophyticus]